MEQEAERPRIIGPLVEHFMAEPAPGSRRYHCRDCMREVWIAPSGQAVMALEGAVPICLECLPGDANPEVAPGALQELIALGLVKSRAELDALMVLIQAQEKRRRKGTP